jgi:hypothetical protein
LNFKEAVMKFLYPVPPDSIVTQTFQGHVDRAHAHGWRYYNGGIDWAVVTGTPIKSAQKGKVVATRRDATGYGTHVRVQHVDGFMTIYAHLLDFNVSVGDQVAVGDVLGRSDNTGNSTGPHLHFELRHHGTAIDPHPLLVREIPGDGEKTEWELEPEETDGGETPESFPALPKVKVTVVALNIRRGPGIDNPIIGLLQNGEVVDVIEMLKLSGDRWLRIGHEQYIALRYNGEYLAKWQ